MSRTAAKIGEPARYGVWGLTVDKMSHPREFVITRYADDNRRHTTPYEEVARIAYTPNVESAVVELTEKVGISRGTATALVFRLSMKLASSRAASADLGVRPVV